MARITIGRGMEFEIPIVCEACGSDVDVRVVETERNIMNRSFEMVVECHGRRQLTSITDEYMHEVRSGYRPIYVFGGDEERRIARTFRSFREQGRAIVQGWGRLPGINAVDEYIMEREGPIRIPAEARIDSFGEDYVVRPGRQVRPPPEPPRKPFVPKRRLRLRTSNVDQAPSHPATVATGRSARSRRRPPVR